MKRPFSSKHVKLKVESSLKKTPQIVHIHCIAYFPASHYRKMRAHTLQPFPGKFSGFFRSSYFMLFRMEKSDQHAPVLVELVAHNLLHYMEYFFFYR